MSICESEGVPVEAAVEPATVGACCPPLGRSPMSADLASGLAGMFKALGDPVRLRLVSIVASSPGGQACVCDLLPAFEISQPTVSHHLKVLREAGLLTCRRRGSWVYYRVVPAALAQLSAALTPVDDATDVGTGALVEAPSALRAVRA